MENLKLYIDSYRKVVILYLKACEEYEEAKEAELASDEEIAKWALMKATNDICDILERYERGNMQ